jgi:hypothetical protein
MTLAVVTAGLVSPAGRTAEEHAFFIRARVPAPAASPFLLADGASLDVRFCPWIGARASIIERMVSMGEEALSGAVELVTRALHGDRAPLLLCMARPRPGLSEAARVEIEEAIAKRASAATTARFWEDAGAFAALAEAQALVGRGEARAVIVMAVDSYVSLDALTNDVMNPPGPWAGDRLPRSEGAAALVVMSPAEARREGLDALGYITGSVALPGDSNDDNDEIVDGAAMTAAIRALPASERLPIAFGQDMVDSLRRREWHMALGRNAGRFDVTCIHDGIEDRIGRVGAAAGAMNVVYGLSILAHRASQTEAASGGPLIAWAISRDGTRGAATAAGELEDA